MADIASLTSLIEPAVTAEGFALVRIKMIGGTSDPTLQVMAEDPETRQLTLDACASLSRRISDILDESDPIEDAYRLEVSSPGIDRPLTRLADFTDWAGHEARIALAEPRDGRKQLTGDLAGLEGDDIVIDVRGLGETRLPFSAVRSAKLLVTDRLIKATKPLLADGADSIQVEGQD